MLGLMGFSDSLPLYVEIRLQVTRPVKLCTVAEVYRSRAIFLSLIVSVYLYSLGHDNPRKAI